MRLLRLILLTGTVLPGLLLVQTVGASPDRIHLAQGGPEERGPRGGEPPHGGPRPERPPQERPGPQPGPPAARERPEPRPERAAPPPPPRERPEPPAQRQPQAESPQRERAPERRPEPPTARPPAQERPDRPQERQQDRRDRQPDRPDRDTQERPAPGRPGPERQQAPERDQAPAPPPRPNPERPPAPPQQRPAPDRDRPGPDTQPNRPAQRDAAPDRTTPDRGPPGQRPGGPGTPGDRPQAPDAAPGGPGRPVQRPDTQPENRQFQNRPQPSAGPGAEPGRPVPPNMAPGVPGRPVQPQNAQPDGRPQVPPNGAPGAEPGRPLPPNMAPGVPGRPFVPPGQAPAPGQAPPPGGVQPGQPPAGGPGAFNRPGQPGYVSGGFSQNDNVRDFEQVRTDRREFREDGRTYYREPGRIIVQDRDRYLIRHDENERFRDLDPRGYRFERRGADFYSTVDRPGGEQIITVTDDDGRLLRRYRRYRDGREIVLIDNSSAGPLRPVYEDVVVLPPPDIRIPRERYIADYAQADEGEVYEALTAPPVVAVDRRYTLDQIRYSPDLRARLRAVDINTITFDTGSFTVTPDQAAKLSVIAAAMNRAIQANPQEVFLIEGFTDAVGSAIDNLSLSDRRAQSVATVLTQQFQVPPENLTTQGYGEQYLKVDTQGPSRENRRVVVQRITPLLQQGQGQGQAAPPPPPR
ncbi:OmpA family protein [Methylobacterium tardum]|uniref:OmpA family protein n=1 Tax=Methylobacterium tardum TaxID=374432 RepID=UPI002021A19A|nr:OmpA family protein [Methylobacterium tardum]URD34737.1 OmpA family protein [Methylobacterium tardum]